MGYWPEGDLGDDCDGDMAAMTYVDYDRPPMPRNYEKCPDCGNDRTLQHRCDNSAQVDAAIAAFDQFIRKWVESGYQGHLLDSDDNDGERVRRAIRALTID